MYCVSTGNSVEKGSDAQAVVTVVFIVSGCLGVLLGALLFYRLRRPSKGKLTCSSINTMSSINTVTINNRFRI